MDVECGNWVHQFLTNDYADLGKYKQCGIEPCTNKHAQGGMTLAYKYLVQTKAFGNHSKHA